MEYNDVEFEVQVEAGIHSTSGQVYATFHSIDSNTGLPPTVDIGFLPPEDGTGRGQGHISYTIRPKPDLPTGTQITNSASISFDLNPAFVTNETVNIIRATPADFDLSGEVDFVDFAKLAGQWHWVGPVGTVDEDIVPDGTVDFSDLAMLAENWLK